MKKTSKFAAILLLALSACEEGFLVSRTGVFAGGGVHSYFTATINSQDWSSSGTSAEFSSGIIIIIAWGKDPYGRDVDMRLAMRSTVGPSAQVIGGDEMVSADITLRDGNRLQHWTARSFQGSGTFRVTSVSAESVEGTFEFVAPGTTASASPSTYRAIRGTFSAPVQ